MDLGSDLTVLEELTSNVKQIQDDVLTEILKLNSNTEYLRRFLHGSSDKDLFKKNVPVISYEDVKPYIDRVANGEPSDIISGKPITRFLQSSGTSSGKPKIFPMNNILYENHLFISALQSLLISKHVDGFKLGKVVKFIFTQLESRTPCGLPLAPASTTLFKSENFRNWRKNYTSPDEIVQCSDAKQSMYCHLLCALVQRNDVVSIGSTYASTLVQAINFLENYWKELCDNIRYGHVSEWITDLGCRGSVSIILGEYSNPELADLIEHECRQKSWEGIIPRLWPKVKFLEGIVTGVMAQYIPTLEFYSNKLPIVSTMYMSTETFFGINVNPLNNPQNVSYTFLPNMSYFEFLEVDMDGRENMEEIVDLVNVKLGCYYETLVTNYAGLHRCRVGDIVQVTGFYNNTPQFRFVRRRNTVLSIHLEATTEEDILKAMSRATLVVESSNLMLTGFTCYADVSTVPGHYVFYLELKAKHNNSNSNVVLIDDKVLVECCCVMEESFNDWYRVDMKDGYIGALEIRVVQQGTFDSLMSFSISRGSSITQYKTPICVNSPEALAVLEDKVLARFFSDKSPSI